MKEEDPVKELKILFPYHASPFSNTYQTISIRNIVEEFKKVCNVQLYWFVYSFQKIEFFEKKSNEHILQIQDFSDALDLLKNTKPDVIFVHASPGEIHYSISLAAKSLGIPTIGDFLDFTSSNNKKTRTLVKTYSRQIFDSKIPGENPDSEKIFMKRGRFFIYKIIFLMKTLKKLKKNNFLILKILIKNFLFYLSNTHSRSPDYANTLHWVETEKLKNELIHLGFDKSSLVVTGNPIYDKVFQTISKYKNQQKFEKIRVLFVTNPLVEHGELQKKDRDDLMVRISKTLKTHSDKIDFQIKLHSNENFQEYESIIHKHNPKIKISQKGDFLNYLEKSNVLIFYSSKTTAAIYSLLSEKPIIILPFKETDIFIERDLAIKGNIDNLAKNIFDVLKLEIPNKNKKQEFIKEFLYSDDGKASKRIVDVVIDLLSKNRKF